MLVRINSLMSQKDIEDTKESYQAFSSVIRDFKQQRYQIWLDILTEQAKDNGLHLRLDKPLLKRVEIEGPVRGSVELVSNFDEDLLALFSEVSYWEKFHGEFSIPYMAHDICTKREQLRIMREQVMFIVRAYNDIIKDMNSEEKRLFLDPSWERCLKLKTCVDHNSHHPGKTPAIEIDDNNINIMQESNINDLSDLD
jgi:hypothetical protein